MNNVNVFFGEMRPNQTLATEKGESYNPKNTVPIVDHGGRNGHSSVCLELDSSLRWEHS